MGSENLHHKRKHEARRHLTREKNKRAPYDFVLIVCEGKKTEPYYFEGLKKELQLNSANIKVEGTGSDPLSLVSYALDLYNSNNDYDRIYCVFDQDEHHNYNAAINKIKKCKSNGAPIYGIISVPCFEYWLLLHYSSSTRPYSRSGNKSAGDQLVRELKAHIPDYTKGYKNIFNETKEHIHAAIDRARKNYTQQSKIGTDNPSTRVYELIEYLMKIKN